jgi:hypothetical protein
LVQQIKHYTFKPAAPITWLSIDPVWVDQWSFTGEKLAVATALVEEQLKAGHIEPTHSPWNTPVFVIRKKVRKMEALTGFKSCQQSNAVNGSTPAWLSSPTAIP